MRGMGWIVLAAGLAGCTMAPGLEPVPATRPVVSAPPDFDTAARNFVRVVQEVEPVAESLCRQQRPDLNCDFQIVIDNRPGAAPNAFHTLDQASGRPLIGFTLALIQDARNADELAFVLGHEAGHHIAGHLGRTQTNAMAGALVLGAITAIGGGNASMVQQAQQIGATVGARRYSQGYELEADAVGTIIAWRAGYDAARGAEFFSRLPDPGNTFLGSHPPNAQRMQTVQRTLADIAAGRVF